MKLIGTFRDRAETSKNKPLNYYLLYFVRLAELLAVIVVLKIYGTVDIICSFAFSTVVFVIVIITVISYFGALNQNLWGLIYTKNQRENSCFVQNFDFPFFFIC